MNRLSARQLLVVPIAVLALVVALIVISILTSNVYRPAGLQGTVYVWNNAPAGATSQLTPEEMKALGVEGDTPRDTVATLVAQVKQFRNELQTALTDNNNQKAENERMRAREGAIDQRIQPAWDGERSRLQQDREQVANDRQQTQGLLQDLQRRLDSLSGKGGQADLPVISARANPVVHRVKSGETLWSIARAYRTTVEAIRSGNLYLFSRPLQVGDTLTILPSH